jgi:hypothetical protein
MFQEAMLMNVKHKDAFGKFSSTFPSNTIEKWVHMVECWEANPKAPNLYEEPEKSMYLK